MKKKIFIIVISIVFIVAIIISTISCTQNNNVKPEETDIYDIIDQMDNMVRYIDCSLTSRQDIENTDFLYFLFGLALNENKTQSEIIEHDYNGWQTRSSQHTVSTDVLVAYMERYFDIGEEYFDKYKNGGYDKYQTPHDFYDPDTDTFKFLAMNDYLWGFGDYIISRIDTKIYITGNDITVKTMYMYDKYYEDIRNSVDYRFTAHNIDANIYYKLESVNIYNDDRNKNTDIVLSVDGINLTAPWVSVERNGKSEYYTLFPFEQASYHSWDVAVTPYNTGIWLSGVRNNTAYFMFTYKGIFDVYLYDTAKKTGKFMSGAYADDFSAYYDKEIEYYQSEPACAYFNYYIVSMPPESDFALMRRSKNKGESRSGEYYMLNLKTRKETYICDSYTRDYIISYMEEYYVWVDNNHLSISVFLEDSHPTYEAIYDGKTWVVTLAPVME